MQKKGCSRSIKLDLGSGFIKRDGFLSVDIDKNCTPDIIADIRTLKPIKNNSVDEIFTSHTLEHVSLDDLFHTLRTFYRVLKPGGKITIIVPDTFRACKDWVDGTITTKQFEWVIMGGDPTATKFQLHRNIFSDKKLERFILISGFVKITVEDTLDGYELTATAQKPGKEKNDTRKSTSRNR